MKENDLTLKDAIAQMIVVRASGYLFDRQIRYPAWEADAATLQHWLEDLHLGGVILLGGSAGELYLRSRQLQGWSKIPLLIAADIEEGVGQRFAGASWFPPPMAISAISDSPRDYAYAMGEITAREALAIGINWILAPVVDVNNNPENPVINVRAFGETPHTVSELATAFIEGAKNHPILTTAKHFPGHGDTANDSHLNLPVIPHSEERLQKIELPPFRSAIEAGVDSVMSAHLLIPAWDKDRPATLSQTILTGQLRKNLGFEGLIVTDALIMGGVAKFASPSEVAVMAVEAGADILLMPENPEVTISAILQAVETGRIAPERIYESVKRIFNAKEKVFGEEKLEGMQWVSILESPETTQTVTETIEKSLQMGGKIPLAISPSESSPTNLILVDDAVNCSDFLGRHTPAVALLKKLGYTTVLVDSNNLCEPPSSPTLLQVFIRGNPFRGTAGLTPPVQNWIKKMLRNGTISGIVLYGSPYVLDWLQPQLNSDLPWVFCYGQMPLAQKIALLTLLDLSRFDDFDTGNFM